MGWTKILRIPVVLPPVYWRNKMGRLEELWIDEMDYPFGRCRKCGEGFSWGLRDNPRHRFCPVCGEEIDDFRSFESAVERENRLADLFCDACGHRIYEVTEDGEGGDWIDDRAGVCGDGCGRELCGRCGNWHPVTGMCASCHEKNLKRDTDGSFRK
jgi:hypothetical protein